MPLYKSLTLPHQTKAHFWKVAEPEDELAKGIVLTKYCQKRMANMKSAAHRRAFLSIRHLLALEGYEDKDLEYSDFGKPFLKDGTHISISHSHEFTGVIISKYSQVGIDIEKQRDKILRIAHKFTPLQEYRTLANTDALIQKLTMVWCAKECLYKIFETPGLSFLDHIVVNDFSVNDAGTTAEIWYKGKRTLFSIFFGGLEGFSFAHAFNED